MNLYDYLTSSNELAKLTSQNGWIDNSTLAVKVIKQDEHGITAEVRFDEVIMEGSGCVADRKQCFGIVKAKLSDKGEVEQFALA